MDECKPLIGGVRFRDGGGESPAHMRLADVLDTMMSPSERHSSGKGLHSFTFQLSLSAFCRMGDAIRGCLGGVRGNKGVFRVYFMSETAQVELTGGRV